MCRRRSRRPSENELVSKNHAVSLFPTLPLILSLSLYTLSVFISLSLSFIDLSLFVYNTKANITYNIVISSMGEQRFALEERQRTEPEICSRTFIVEPLSANLSTLARRRGSENRKEKGKKRKRRLSGRLDTNGGSMKVVPRIASCRLKKSHMFKVKILCKKKKRS